MISEKVDVKTSFLQQWIKFIPTVIEYGEKSMKREVQLILADLNDTGWQNTIYRRHLVV